MLVVNPSMQPIVDYQIYVYGSYEPATLFVMSRLLSAGDGMLDLGANIGQMSCYCARLVGSTGSVVAVEPSTLSISSLEANVEMNDLANVKVVNMGAGAERTTVPLFHRPEVGSGGATMRSLPDRSPGESVQIDRVDDILTGVDHASIRFVKIDVEGYEFEAITGAPDLLRRRPIVCMEYSRLVHQSSARLATDLLLDALDARAFLARRDGRGYSLVEVVGESEFPEQDNIYFIPRARIQETRSTINVVDSGVAP